MVMRVEDRGKSERPTVMVGIRVATLSDAKAADFLLVSDHERTWQIGLIGSADDGASWCNPKYEFEVGRR